MGECQCSHTVKVTLYSVYVWKGDFLLRGTADVLTPTRPRFTPCMYGRGTHCCGGLPMFSHRQGHTLLRACMEGGLSAMGDCRWSHTDKATLYSVYVWKGDSLLWGIANVLTPSRPHFTPCMYGRDTFCYGGTANVLTPSRRPRFTLCMYGRGTLCNGGLPMFSQCQGHALLRVCMEGGLSVMGDCQCSHNVKVTLYSVYVWNGDCLLWGNANVLTPSKKVTLYSVYVCMEGGLSAMGDCRCSHTDKATLYSVYVWKGDSLLWGTANVLTSSRPRFTPCMYGRGLSAMGDCRCSHTDKATLYSVYVWKGDSLLWGIADVLTPSRPHFTSCIICMEGGLSVMGGLPMFSHRQGGHALLCVCMEGGLSVMWDCQCSHNVKATLYSVYVWKGDSLLWGTANVLTTSRSRFTPCMYGRGTICYGGLPMFSHRQGHALLRVCVEGGLSVMGDCRCSHTVTVTLYSVYVWKGDSLLWGTTNVLTPSRSRFTPCMYGRGTLCYGGLPMFSQCQGHALLRVCMEGGLSVMGDCHCSHTVKVTLYSVHVWKGDFLLWGDCRCSHTVKHRTAVISIYDRTGKLDYHPRLSQTRSVPTVVRNHHRFRS